MRKIDKMRLDPNSGPPTITVIGKRNSGKCLGKNTPVMLSSGKIINVQKVKVGDLLMGPDSKPRTVLSVARGKGRLYNIKQEYGIDYVVNQHHILTVIKNNEIVDIPLLTLHQQSGYKGIKANHIHFHNEIEEGYDSRDIYQTATNASVINKETLDKILTSNYDIRKKYMFGLLDSKFTRVNDCYVYNSKNARLKDTQIKDMQKKLQHLANSVGFLTKITDGSLHVYEPSELGKIEDVSYVSVNISITAIGMGEYYGFEITGDGRFLLGDFTITHNTTFIRKALHVARHIPTGSIFCGSAGGREAYSEIFPESFIHNDVDVDTIDKILKNQEKLRKEHGRDLKVVDYSTAIICDDCSFDSKILNNRVIKELIFNGRHNRILFIYAMHYCVQMKPELRGNMDFVFVLREPNVDIRKKLHAYYFGIIPKFSDFCQVMDRCTENYGCLVLDNTVRSNKIEDCIFWYRAEYPLPKFRFGTKEFWTFHKELKDKEAKPKSEKKKSTTIVVDKT